MTTTIYDGKNNSVGTLVESGNQIRAFSRSGTLMGYYDKSTDKTMNKNNSLHSRGNSVRSLLFN